MIPKELIQNNMIVSLASMTESLKHHASWGKIEYIQPYSDSIHQLTEALYTLSVFDFPEEEVEE